MRANIPRQSPGLHKLRCSKRLFGDADAAPFDGDTCFASTHAKPIVASPPCIATTALRAVCRFGSNNSPLPLPRSGFADRPTRFASLRDQPHRRHEGADSCPACTCRTGLSAYVCLAFRTSRPQPFHGPERRFRSRLTALDGQCDQGFAMDEQACRAMPPKRVCHSTRCSSPPASSHPVSRRRSCFRLRVIRLRIGRTFTSPLTKESHGRTHPGKAGGSPLDFRNRQIYHPARFPF